jgi:hypothetical protein
MPDVLFLQRRYGGSGVSGVIEVPGVYALTIVMQ